MDKEIIKELIQRKLNTNKLNDELIKILNPNTTEDIRKNYQIIREKLGSAGASKKTAQLIYEQLTTSENEKY